MTDITVKYSDVGVEVRKSFHNISEREKVGDIMKTVVPYAEYVQWAKGTPLLVSDFGAITPDMPVGRVYRGFLNTWRVEPLC